MSSRLRVQKILNQLTRMSTNGDELVAQDPNKAIHREARSSPYVNTAIERLKISDDKVRWDCDYIEYKPPFYTDPLVTNHIETDPSLDKIKSDVGVKLKA